MGPAAAPMWIAVVVVGLAGLAMVAYALRALDLWGSVVSFLLGALVALVAGTGWLALLVLFTVLGFASTRIGLRRKRAMRAAEANDGERGVPNVLANGAAAGLAALAVLVVEVQVAALAFAAAVAAVAADTLASEIGSLSRRARSVLPPFRPVVPGANGGVSRLGQAAAAFGAALIALAAVPLVGLPMRWVWIPAVAGFVGCQLDSLLGATLEKDHLNDRPLSKEDVNFVASAVPALFVLVAAALLL